MRHPTLALALFASLLVLTAGCRTPRQPYIADAPRDEALPINTSATLRLAPGDMVYIHVDSRMPESVVRFNEETNMIRTSRNRHGYLVSPGGIITFPILGPLEVDGLTLHELERMVERRLITGRYVTDPTVTAELLNFHVAVIGEVATPKVVHCSGTRLTLFEAIAQCGDITMDGRADKVVVLRDMPEGQWVDTVDLTRKEVFDSPCYYLQQNDVVYIEPTERKKRTSYREEDWSIYITTGAAILRLAWHNIYRIRKNL